MNSKNSNINDGFEEVDYNETPVFFSGADFGSPNTGVNNNNNNSLMMDEDGYDHIAKKYNFDEFEGEDREDHSFIEVESLISQTANQKRLRMKKILCGSIGIIIVMVFVMLMIILLNHKAGPMKYPEESLDPIIAITNPLLIISLDGFRWDYLNRGITPNIMKLVDEGGVRANFTTPQFPSKTFPNHYTIVTGLLPEYNGIISNHMYDPETGKRFDISRNADDGSWYWGEPIWITAFNNELTSACYLYPGCSALIQKLSPNFNIKPYVDTPSDVVIDKVIDWLKNNQPDLTLAYVSEIDHNGHVYGPNSQQVNDSIASVDKSIGTLIDYLKSSNTYDKINIVIVSDHGMTDVSEDKLIFIDKCINTSQVNIIDYSPVLSIFPLDGDGSLTPLQIEEKLKNCHPNLTMYLKENVPASYYFSSPSNDRIAPVIGVADIGWFVTTQSYGLREKGDHGYLPNNPDMFSIFVGHGPNIKRFENTNSNDSQLLKDAPQDLTFKNLDLYNFFTKLLNLTQGVSEIPSTNSTSYLSDLIFKNTSKIY